MARRQYIVDKALLKCTLGTSEGKIKAISQQNVSINGKLKITSNDKTLEPPFFGSCKCSNPNPPCSPALQEWQKTSKKVVLGSETFVMDDSQIQCSKGGIITISKHNQ